MFEAEDELTNDSPEAQPQEDDQNTNIEIAPPAEDTQTNSSFFYNGKIKNDTIHGDAAVQNLIKIMTADMQDETTIKPYIDDFFTKLGINDVDSEKFKLFSGDIWNKLEELSDLDTTTSLAEFQTWAKLKIDEYNR